MSAPPPAADREHLGRLVRDIWCQWAREQPAGNRKPSWLTPWAELGDGQREVDMRIGEAVAAGERRRIYLALFGCTTCGKVHEPRSVPRTRENGSGVDYRDPVDGHAYAAGWSQAHKRGDTMRDVFERLTGGLP